MSILTKLKSIKNGWYNSYLYWTGRLPDGIKELMDVRLQECRSNKCGQFMCGVCMACGCTVSKKVKSITEECPENMWNPAIYQIGNSAPFILLEDIPPKLQRSFFLFNKKATKESPKELQQMREVEQPWVRKATWDKFLEWWEEQLNG